MLARAPTLFRLAAPSSVTFVPGHRDQRLLGHTPLSTPLPASRAMAENFEGRLKSLGLYETTDASIFHEWAASFPSGIFDGHHSIPSAPDHLLFCGMTKNLITAIFLELKDSQCDAAEMSLRECLRDSLLRRTRMYNSKTKKTNSLAISD